MNMKRRDALARDINLEDITSSNNNAEVLQRLRDNDRRWGFQDTLFIEEAYDGNDDGDDMVFMISEGDDLGWLGYFIGRNQSLDALAIHFLPQERERVDAFIKGVNYNRSLREFSLVYPMDLGLHNLCSFFRDNNNLRSIHLCRSQIGRECAHELALALSQRQAQSLMQLDFINNNLDDEGFAEIVQALWTQPQLDRLLCSSNNIGRISCEALGALMRERMTNLTRLHLPNSGIDDACLQALVPGFCSSNNLEVMSISDPITAVGLRSLSPFLQSDSCILGDLNIILRLGYAEAAALVDALKGNKSSSTVNLLRNATDAGWSEFSKLLCDTSSINNTYLSNHNLTHIGAPNDMDDTPTHVTDLLEMNAAAAAQSSNMRNREIAMQSLTRCKIFMSHPDLDMEPLFVYKLKCLPLVAEWFRTSIQLCSDEVGSWKESVPELESRELSAVYKFVRDMPLLVSDGYWTNVLNDSRAKKQRLQEEKRKLEMMLQRADENEKCAMKRLRR
uniref:Uncharacterized protein n=1 Tax=Skeletonema marinoi TaxID=267567 RepID=A0A7S2P416_9STRA|mmetsp:Transcript_12342/g.20929  ORF Transcript_12342/g.20929 Transcript_12342/m.20929 type:complete len:505 (+) Transcript_12342:48-1562(+)